MRTHNHFHSTITTENLAILIVTLSINQPSLTIVIVNLTLTNGTQNLGTIIVTLTLTISTQNLAKSIVTLLIDQLLPLPKP